MVICSWIKVTLNTHTLISRFFLYYYNFFAILSLCVWICLCVSLSSGISDLEWDHDNLSVNIMKD